MNKGTGSEADSSITNNATRGSILSVNKGTGSEADSSITNNATRGSILSVNKGTGSEADSFINPLHLMTSLLITSLNFHQSYFSNFAFKY
ncbi:hypothetical protein [Lactococcus lactis]|uniref:hypothetical protein n=1 Tax=Lactococcus lactis TaxID=1358 RepID=UPI001899FD78|nr:hypothetical protein [Lactococcus lactis]